MVHQQLRGRARTLLCASGFAAGSSSARGRLGPADRPCSPPAPIASLETSPCNKPPASEVPYIGSVTPSDGSWRKTERKGFDAFVIKLTHSLMDVLVTDIESAHPGPSK